MVLHCFDRAEKGVHNAKRITNSTSNERTRPKGTIKKTSNGYPQPAHQCQGKAQILNEQVYHSENTGLFHSLSNFSECLLLSCPFFQLISDFILPLVFYFTLYSHVTVIPLCSNIQHRSVYPINHSTSYVCYNGAVSQR